MAQRLKVLVVDDDPVTLEVTKAVLEGLGHAVLTRGQALGTTPVAMAERPDVIILDVRMPGLSGGELLGVIRKGYLARNVPPPQFILYSGLAAEALARLVEETGALGAIEKSGNPNDFAQSFAELTQVPRA
jgi:CheY-like chemotaxis protein